MTKIHKTYVGALLAVAAFFGFTGSAFAQSTDPQTAVEELLSEGTGSIVLIVIAVATAALGLLVLGVGFRMAWRALKSKGQSVA